MKSIENINEDIIQVQLEITKYKKSSNRPTNWRIGRQIDDVELVKERDALFKVMHIIDEAIKSNNIIIRQLQDTKEDNEKLNLLKENNQNLTKFIIDFFK